MGTTLLLIAGSSMLVSSSVYIAKYGFGDYLAMLDELMDKVWHIDNVYEGDE